MLMNEVMLFEPVMQQSYLQKLFYRKFHQKIATITPRSPIEFFVKNAAKLYLNLNNSRFMVRCQIVKKDGTNMPAADACKSGVVNLLLHSFFKKVTVLFNNKKVSDPSNMYAYRSYLETLLNCNGDIEKYRLTFKGWHNDKQDKMDEAEPKDNTGLVERRKYCAESPDIVLIGRPHSDVFHIDKLIPAKIDVSVKLMPNDDKFCIMSCDGDNLKPTVVIDDMILIICTKQLSDAPELAHKTIVGTINMRLSYTRVLMKHVAIPADSSTVCLDNIFTSVLFNLVVIGFVTDTAFAGSYTENPYNFKNVKIKRTDLFRNGTRVPQFGYLPNFPKKIYNQTYLTFQKQLAFDQGDCCVNISPEEWADGFNLYSFKITNGPIGSGTVSPRSHSETGSARLEFDFETAPHGNLKLIIMYQMLGIFVFDR